MTARRTYVPARPQVAGLTTAGLLIAGMFAAIMIAGLVCRADSGTGNQLTVTEYRAELDQLLAATQELDSSEHSFGNPVPLVLRELPPNWRVRSEQQDFEISAEGLRRDVRRFEQEKDFSSANAVRLRIQNLRRDLDGFETPPPDVSQSREHLAAILARREFRDVSGPTFLDRLAQSLLAFVIGLLERLFSSSAIPTISKFLVYGLIGLALLTLAYVVYRQIKSSSARESVVPTDLPVSAKYWALWLAEARAAAAQHNWREAVHFGYWAGISFLELKGTWRPDRARTPREYLRLLSNSSEHREPLAALTRIFELTWYAKREADAGTFAQTMRALERLGCHSS